MIHSFCNFELAMLDKKVKIGVIGVGHLGQHHVKHPKTSNFSKIYRV